MTDEERGEFTQEVPTPEGESSAARVIADLREEVARLRSEVQRLTRRNTELLTTIVDRDHERPPHWG
jgi:hypothetical protein